MKLIIPLTIITTTLPALSFALLPTTFPPTLKTPSPTLTPLYSTLSPPPRVPPSAGYTPEWEDIVGLPTEEFMLSDMNKPDLGDNLLECPLTRWDFKGIDLEEVRRRGRTEMTTENRKNPPENPFARPRIANYPPHHAPPPHRHVKQVAPSPIVLPRSEQPPLTTPPVPPSSP